MISTINTNKSVNIAYAGTFAEKSWNKMNCGYLFLLLKEYFVLMVDINIRNSTC